MADASGFHPSLDRARAKHIPPTRRLDAGDARLGLTCARLDELFAAGASRTGAPAAQTNALATTAAATVKPGEIL